MLLCILFVLNLIQSLLDIIEDVFYIFDTYREANQIWRNTCFLQLLFAELAMGVTGRMEHTGAGIGYMGYDVDHVERIHKLDGCIAVSLQSEGNNTAGAVWHILLGKRMILIALQTAIMNPSHTLIVLQNSATFCALAQCWRIRRWRLWRPRLRMNEFIGAGMLPRSRIS